MSTTSPWPLTSPVHASETLRLIWPQWQGAGAATAGALVPEVPPAVAHRGYVAGARALAAILPEHPGPTELVPVPLDNASESSGGIESRAAILNSLAAALRAINAHPQARRILTLGGDCSVSVAPFAALAQRYDGDIAVVWVDSHPDVDTPETGYDGYHAMAVSALLGKGPDDVVRRLPAIFDPSRVALAGLHDWVEDAYANIGRWALATFAPNELRSSSTPLLDWFRSTGASKLAIHFDVDTIDCNEMTLGLGAVPGGLRSAEVRRLVADLAGVGDVVGLTVAEFIPRNLLQLGTVLAGMPLIGS